MKVFGYVYVISTKLYESENIVKIGCTKNLDKRLTTLNSTRVLFDKFFIIKYWRTTHYYETELGLHKKLDSFRINNEFFKCSLNDIEEQLINFLNEQSPIFILPDAVYVFKEIYEVKWKDNFKYFKLILKNNQLLIVNEKEILKLLLDFLQIVDKNGFFKFISKDYWDIQLNILKQNTDQDSIIDLNSLFKKFEQMIV